MKKILIFAFFILLSFTKNAYCDSEISKIQERKKLVVAVYQGDYFPFVFWNNDKPYGYDIDIAKSIAKELGVDIKYNKQAKTFSEIIDVVKEKKADIGISAISYSSKRAQKVLYSQPYMSLKMGILINRLKFNSLEKIYEKKHKIAVLASSAHVKRAKDYFNNASFYYETNPVKCIKSVLENKSDAYFGDEILIKNYKLENPQDNLMLKSFLIDDYKDFFSIILPYDSNHFKEWLNWHIKTKIKKTSLDEIFTKYKALREEIND